MCNRRFCQGEGLGAVPHPGKSCQEHCDRIWGASGWNEDEFDLAQVKEELADVLNYCMRLASVLDLDVRQIVLDKIEKNRAKYPIEKAKGRSVKYDRL